VCIVGLNGGLQRHGQNTRMDKKRIKRAFRFSITLALLLTALAATLLATWSARRNTADSQPWNAWQIEPGMTKRDVSIIMGSYHFLRGLDVWSYRLGRSVRGDGGPTVEIVFKDGRVTEVRDGYEPPPQPRRPMRPIPLQEEDAQRRKPAPMRGPKTEEGR
jgi:hypothetical protein